MKLIRVFSILFLCTTSLSAQIGGDNTFEFLNLTSSARILALGNVLVNTLDDDVNLAQQLPSLNHAGMNHQLSVNFTNYYAGVKFGSLVYGLPNSKYENISLGMQYLNYGSFTRTDSYGNVIGDFSAGEYAVYASAAIYKVSAFRFGTTLKAVYSNLEAYNSYGILADVSATYELKQERVLASLLVKNAGFQIKTYARESEPMPFEMVLGISAKLEHAPLRWSVSWAHLEKWDLSYEDSSQPEIDLLTNEEITVKNTLRDKILSHLHVGGEFLLGKNFNIRMGYNFRKRQELALDLYKHNVGLSWGFSMKVRKFHFNYARAAYHAVGPMHTLSMTSNLLNFRRK